MRVPNAFEPRGSSPARTSGWSIRNWTIRHSRGMEITYSVVIKGLTVIRPLLKRIGFERLEGLFATGERYLKGLLFGCRMCGQCVLSQTGMSCPMACPKALRNGPCGGVRLNGHCEVIPEMRCVWVAAFDGASKMNDGDRIFDRRQAVDNRMKGKSSFLLLLDGRIDDHGNEEKPSS